MRKAILFTALAAVVFASTAFAASRRATATVEYGKTVTLRAKVPGVGGIGALKVTVVSKSCAFTGFVDVGTPRVSLKGTVAYRVEPTMNTIYKVLVLKNQALSIVKVRVRPVIALTRLAGGKIRVTATTGNGNGLAGKQVALQQKQGLKRWKTVRAVRLKLISRPDQINAVAAGSTVFRGAGRIRAVLTAAQAKPCFAPAKSPSA